MCNFSEAVIEDIYKSLSGMKLPSSNPAFMFVPIDTFGKCSF